MTQQSERRFTFEDVMRITPQVHVDRLRLCPPPDEWKEWLAENAIPISTEPDADPSDLLPLLPRLRRATVVSLGESTHGTSEHFRLKHRLVRLLVEEAGFGGLCMEAHAGAAVLVDRWVRGGGEESDAVDLVTALGTPWDTEEVLAVVRWMRRHNRDLKETQQVGFFGIDCQVPMPIARSLAAELDVLAPDLLSEFGESAIRPMATDIARNRRIAGGAEAAVANLSALDQLRSAVDSRAESSPAPDRYRWQYPALLAHGLRQVAEVSTVDIFVPGEVQKLWDMRDGFMAKNVAVVQRLGNRPVACWAHNMHVLRTYLFKADDASGVTDDVLTMGSHLDGLVGRNQHAIVGFSYASGTHRANTATGSAHVDLGPAPEGTLDHAAVVPGSDAIAIDLGMPKPRAVEAWLDSPVPSRCLSNLHMGDDAATYVERAPSGYDVLIAVAQASGATLLPRSPGPSSRPEQLAASTSNLDLQAWADGVPVGWWFNPGAAPRRARIDSRESAGRRVVVIDTREAFSVFGALADFAQWLDAEGFRGRSLRVSGRARAEVAGFGSEAEFYASAASGPGSAKGAASAPLGVLEERHEVQITVPDDATVLSFGVTVQGTGFAEISGFEFEVLEDT